MHAPSALGKSDSDSSFNRNSQRKVQVKRTVLPSGSEDIQNWMQHHQIRYVELFVKLVTEKVDSLTSHHYIAKSQAEYLRRCQDAALVLRMKACLFKQ